MAWAMMATNDEDVEEVGGNQGNVDEGDDDEIIESDISWRVISLSLTMNPHRRFFFDLVCL